MRAILYKLNLLLGLLLFCSVLDLPLVDSANAAASPCNPACPVWMSGADLPPCDPATKCSSFRSDWMYIPDDSGLSGFETDVLTTHTKATVPVIPPYEDSMHIVVARNSSSTCEPVCPEWLSLSGRIMPDTPSKLRKILKQLGTRRLPVVINSSGGAVNAAMEMGRLIRKKGLDVAVGRTNFEGRQPNQKGCKPLYSDKSFGARAFPGGAVCMSACPFVVAGGKKRLIGPWAQIGIHQITTTVIEEKITYQTIYRITGGKKRIVDKKILSRQPTGTYNTTELRKSYRKKLDRYFSEMGVDAAIVERMLSIPASDIFVLPYVELKKLKLASGPGDVGDFTEASICAQLKFENCIELSAITPK